MYTECRLSSPRSTVRSARLRALAQALAFVAALFALVPAASAQERVIPDSLPERPRVATYDPGLPFLEKTLKNGVHLLVQEQRTAFTVAGVATMRMGTRYEDDETSGLGNLLLQTMIRGTSKSSGSDFLVRQRGNNVTFEANIGADIGQIAMSSDRDHAAGAAALLADVILYPALADTSFEAERVKATGEATFAAESPIPSAYAQFLNVMYAGTPYRHHLQGLVSSIAQARRSDIVALHKKVTVGGNLTIVFVGNLDGKKLMAQLEKSFAAVPSGPPIEPAGPEPTPLAADTVVTVEKPWLAHAVIIGFPAPGYADPDWPAFAMIDSYLRSEDRSPITYWLQVRDDAVSPGIVFPLYPHRASIAAYFGATPEKLPVARDTTLAVMTRIREQAFEKGEWVVQLKRVQDGFFFKQNDPMVRARMISRYVAEGVGLDYPQKFETALLKLTPDDVLAAAKRWFTHSCQVYMGPAAAPSAAPPGDEKP